VGDGKKYEAAKSGARKENAEEARVVGLYSWREGTKMGR
jgi:hypothetical protein